MHYEHVTYHGAFSDLAVVLSAVQDKLKKNKYVEPIMLFMSIFLFSHCENLVLQLAEHFDCVDSYE